MVIGEAPGADEDQNGKGFMGRAGRTLHGLLQAHGFYRGEHYGCANVVRCRPLGNRKPTQREIINCIPHLARTIEGAQPEAILAVGETSTRAITGLLGLAYNIQELRAHNMNPRSAEMIYPPELKAVWPQDTILVPIPHTSPLAWNRNAPDGRKWREVGEEQVHILADTISKGRKCKT
ncbi:uracil-DNA glycosylase [Acidithiobacillus thiooxidans]|uniref:uracil-DNA glycosylase n=1 Tax=Acidithiobacillus thiooxidans TaxID=930 RepID=UPI0020CAC6FA|nr:uracil-DNA glycosylase [Acidithiobacillus thiooxidans]